MNKEKVFMKTVWLHNKFLKRFGLSLQMVRDDQIVTKHMAYDAVSNCHKDKYGNSHDYVRYRALELAAEEIGRRYSSEELQEYSVAEAGVYRGDFSYMINQCFPQCKMYLYDTFEGFNETDMKFETREYTSSERMKYYTDLFNGEAVNADKEMRIVKRKLPYAHNCKFRKGYFPESANREKGKKWIFVSLDMDLYKPIKAGIQFFWPKLARGGYIFIHDYNNIDFKGIQNAVSEAEEEFGRIVRFPLPDQGGTIVLCKG